MSEEGYDWTRSYSKWESLENEDVSEKATVPAPMYQTQAVHNHDHAEEREFYERPEDEKLKVCQGYMHKGDYLLAQGCIERAAEQFRVSLSYYEYCFPEDSDQQKRIDVLRRHCLCCLALCSVRLGLGHLREAIDYASQALEEDYDCAVAYLRRAQAYRLLDEYELAAKDLYEAARVEPEHPGIASELRLLQLLASSYERQEVKVAARMLRGQAEEVAGGAAVEGMILGTQECSRPRRDGSIFDISKPIAPEDLFLSL